MNSTAAGAGGGGGGINSNGTTSSHKANTSTIVGGYDYGLECFDVKKLASKQVHTVDDILDALELPELIPVFQRENISLVTFFFLDDATLQGLGLEVYQRVRILRALQLIKDMPEASNKVGSTTLL